MDNPEKHGVHKTKKTKTKKHNTISAGHHYQVLSTISAGYHYQVLSTISAGHHYQVLSTISAGHHYKVLRLFLQCFRHKVKF
jgi:uncharacterized protein YgiM (DUF1202 family)